MTRMKLVEKESRVRWPAVAVVALAASAALLTLVATRDGPVISPDSTTYLSAAEHLGRGEYQDFTQQSLTTFPPGLPVLLRIGEWLGASGENSNRLLNALSIAAAVVLTDVFARRHLRSTWFGIALTGLVAFSVVLYRMAGWASSDILFIPLCLACLLLLESMLRALGRRAFVLGVAAGALTGVAFLVRYAGAALIITGLVLLAGRFVRKRSTESMLRAAGFAGAAVIVPALWIVRDAASGADDLLGPRVARAHFPGAFPRALVDGFSGLFIPPSLVGRFGVIVLVGVAGFAVFAFLMGRAPRRDGYVFRSSYPLSPLLVFIVVYCAIAAFSYLRAGASLDERILAPVFVPIVIVIGVWVADWYAGSEPLHRVLSQRLALGGLTAAAALLVVGMGIAAVNDGSDVRGMASVTRGEASLARQVGQLPAHALVASNDPFLLWYLSHHEPIIFSPGTTPPEVSIRRPSVPELADRVCGTRDAYLAWFGPVHGPKSSLLSPEALAQSFTVTDVAEGPGGTLFRLGAHCRPPQKS